jgi:hypothetical protein
VNSKSRSWWEKVGLLCKIGGEIDDLEEEKGGRREEEEEALFLRRIDHLRIEENKKRKMKQIISRKTQ